MEAIRTFYKMRYLCALIMVMALPAHAQELPNTLAPINVEGTYYFSWSGIPFAKLWLHVEDDAQEYDLTASFKSRGIVRMFKRLKTLSTSRGISDGERSMHALSFSYETDPDVSEKKQTHLSFDTTGMLTSRLVEPEDDPWHRPPVGPEEIVDATIPGNLLWDVRRALYDALKGNNKTFSLMFYEGQRLARVNAEIVGTDYFRIDDEKVKSYKLALKRDLAGGYTQKEIARHAEGEPIAYLYISADSLMMPVGMEIDVKLGTLRAAFERKE